MEPFKYLRITFILLAVIYLNVINCKNDNEFGLQFTNLSPAKISGIRARSLQLECNGKNEKNENLKYEWMQNGFLIKNNDPRFNKKLNGTVLEIRKLYVVIKNGSRSDGKYNCLLCSNDGCILSRNILVVSTRSKASSKKVETSIKVKMGHNIRILCPPQPLTNTVWFSWLFNNEPLQESKTMYTIINSSVLHVVNSTKSNSGTYSCIAHSQNMTNSKITHLKVINVEDDFKYLHFLNDNRTLTNSVYGHIVTLECLINLAKPNAFIHWTRLSNKSFFISNTKDKKSNINNKKIFSASRKKIHTKENELISYEEDENENALDDSDPYKKRFSIVGESNLQIENVNQDDEDDYVCTASYKLDEYNISGFTMHSLKVFDSPIQVRPSKNLFLETFASKLIRLDCGLIYGIPKPSVNWLKNGLPIEKNNHMYIKSDFSDHLTDEDHDKEEIIFQDKKMKLDDLVSSQLVISKTTESDSGFYQCFVESDSGSFTNEFVLKINPLNNQPLPPKNIMVNVIGSKEAIVNWSVPISISEILGYTVHYKGTSNKKIKEEKSVANSNFSHLTKLTPYTNYSLFVRAYSQLNSSNDSEIITFLTGEETPNDLPFLEVNIINKTTVLLKWEPLPDADARGKILYYKIEYSQINFKSEKQEFIKTTNVDAEVNEYLISSLKPGSFYKFKVIAGNSKGMPLDDIIENYDWEKVEMPLFDSNQIRINLTANSNSYNSIKCDWNIFEEENPNDISYLIKNIKLKYQNTDKNEDYHLYDIDKKLKTYLIQDLVENTFYEIEIKFIFEKGGSSFTEKTLVKTLFKFIEPEVNVKNENGLDVDLNSENFSSLSNSKGIDNINLKNSTSNNLDVDILKEIEFNKLKNKSDLDFVKNSSNYNFKNLLNFENSSETLLNLKNETIILDIDKPINRADIDVYNEINTTNVKKDEKNILLVSTENFSTENNFTSLSNNNLEENSNNKTFDNPTAINDLSTNHLKNLDSIIYNVTKNSLDINERLSNSSNLSNNFNEKKSYDNFTLHEKINRENKTDFLDNFNILGKNENNASDFFISENNLTNEVDTKIFESKNNSEFEDNINAISVLNEKIKKVIETAESTSQIKLNKTFNGLLFEKDKQNLSEINSNSNHVFDIETDQKISKNYTKVLDNFNLNNDSVISKDLNTQKVKDSTFKEVSNFDLNINKTELNKKLLESNFSEINNLISHKIVENKQEDELKKPFLKRFDTNELNKVSNNNLINQLENETNLKSVKYTDAILKNDSFLEEEEKRLLKNLKEQDIELKEKFDSFVKNVSNSIEDLNKIENSTLKNNSNNFTTESFITSLSKKIPIAQSKNSEHTDFFKTYNRIKQILNKNLTKNDMLPNIYNFEVNALNSTTVNCKWKSNSLKENLTFTIFYNPIKYLDAINYSKNFDYENDFLFLHTTGTEYNITNLLPFTTYDFYITISYKNENEDDFFFNLHRFLTRKFKNKFFVKHHNSIERLKSKSSMDKNFDTKHSTKYHKKYEKQFKVVETLIEEFENLLSFYKGQRKRCRTLEDLSKAPTEFTGIALDSNSIQLSWKKPLEPNGKIKNYIIFYTDNTEFNTSLDSWQNIVLDSLTFSFIFKDLNPSTKYKFIIKAKNNAGLGKSSVLLSISTIKNNYDTYEKFLNSDPDVNLESNTFKYTKYEDMSYRDIFNLNETNEILMRICIGVGCLFACIAVMAVCSRVCTPSVPKKCKCKKHYDGNCLKMNDLNYNGKSYQSKKKINKNYTGNPFEIQLDNSIQNVMIFPKQQNKFENQNNPNKKINKIIKSNVLAEVHSSEENTKTENSEDTNQITQDSPTTNSYSPYSDEISFDDQNLDSQLIKNDKNNSYEELNDKDFLDNKNEKKNYKKYKAFKDENSELNCDSPLLSNIYEKEDYNESINLVPMIFNQTKSCQKSHYINGYTQSLNSKGRIKKDSCDCNYANLNGNAIRKNNFDNYKNNEEKDIENEEILSECRSLV